MQFLNFTLKKDIFLYIFMVLVVSVMDAEPFAFFHLKPVSFVPIYNIL